MRLPLVVCFALAACSAAPERADERAPPSPRDDRNQVVVVDDDNQGAAAPAPRTFRAFPVVVGSAVFDANETTSCAFGAGCLNSFMYFADAGEAKAGTLPDTYDGVERYDTNAFASNFQGVNLYTGESAFHQWEWSIDNTESTTPRYLGRGECRELRRSGIPCFEALQGAAPCASSCVLYEHDGSCECSTRLRMNNLGAAPAIKTTWGAQRIAQVSKRIYPLVYADETVSAPDAFTTKTMIVKEDDEGIANDTVGRFVVDRSACRVDVFARGMSKGWTTVRRHLGEGDIAFVDVRIWCTSF